jgi:hypothetical protein
MKSIGIRIIDILKNTPSITSLLPANNIVATNIDIKADIKIEVDTSIGMDLNSMPVDSGELSIFIVVSKNILKAPSKCYDLANLVDSVINKQELLLTTQTITVLNIIREDISTILFDTESQDYYIRLSYSYIIEN